MRSKTQRFTKEEFVSRARIVHGDLYDYANFIYIQSTIKSNITCRIHGDFLQKARSHLDGHGCPRCAKTKTADMNRLSGDGRLIRQREFIQKAREIHGDKYDYSDFVYTSALTKGSIICRAHEMNFEQSPNVHLKGHGCSFCGVTKAAISRRYSTNEFIARAKGIHGALYDYGKTVYVIEHKKVIIKCKIHNEFRQTPNNHIFGRQGCPHCVSYLSISKPEIAWLDQLNVPVRQHRLQVSGKTLSVDGYDPETNTVYQFHGDYFHGNPEVYPCPITWNVKTNQFMYELYDKTMRNDKLIRDYGYHLITIWENDFEPPPE